MGDERASACPYIALLKRMHTAFAERYPRHGG
jgi:hypothetical protein